MKKYNASTYKGKQIIEKATRCEGYTLHDVYEKWSIDKEIAYNWCYQQYVKTEKHRNFVICSHNTFGFTCSWYGVINGEKILRYETKDNSYLIYLDR